MNRLRVYFAVVSIIFLVVLAVSPLKDYFREWKWYQHEYNKLIANLPQRVKPVDIGIKQIWNQKLDRTDRCVTCHLGVKEEALASAHEPYRTHPHIFHDVEEFGCTICHEGQGAATEFKESIGNVKYWEKPIIPAEYMEASCGKCHKERNVTDAPILNRGRKLIEEMNCVGCHRIDGYEKQWVPRLDGIGSKVNRLWLVNWLKDPKSYDSTARMPNFLLSDEEANNLADFLLSFKSFTDDAQLDSLPTQLASLTGAQKVKTVELGSTRFREARCISCHPINGRGGYVAPDLGKVASKVSPAWLYNYVKAPKRLEPNVLMPRYRFSEQELDGVVAYIDSEFVDYDQDTTHIRPPDPDFYEKGLALFKKYNCSSCHQLSTMSRPEEMAPELTSIGSKKIYEIDFGQSTIEQTVPSYLNTKLLDPRVFSPAMKMPKFGFSQEDAQAITTALLANTSEKIPDEFIIRPKPASTYAPQGEFGKLVNDLACLGCHVMQGKGRLVATDLSIEASRARREWIEGYFKVPYSLRPILTERMPKLFVSDAEIKTLVDYMENVFIADSITSREIATSDALVVEGRGLYFEKYGCQSCHQIQSKGGYVGPPLDKVGSRLTPGYVFHWLKNPQSLKPESIEPNNGLTDREAMALTDFLMTLK